MFRKDVGYDAFHTSPRKAHLTFDRHYWMKAVSWDGYVVRVNVNEDDPMHMAYNSASLLIKMEQDDREGFHGPDLGLSLSEYILNEFSDDIGSLHRGDHVRFNATLTSVGDTHHLHHLHVFDFKKLDGHRDVEAHANANGRYKVKVTPHDGKEHLEQEN